MYDSYKPWPKGEWQLQRVFKFDQVKPIRNLTCTNNGVALIWMVLPIQPKTARLIGEERDKGVNDGGPASQSFVEKLHFARSQARSLEQMSAGGDFFRFSADRLIQIDIALADPLSVADSWLVDEGNVRGLARHLERFARSITDEVTTSQLPQFFDAVRQTLPRTGSWFPRIEYRADQPVGERLFLRIREAPERSEFCKFWTLDEPDPRSTPLIKGPDLSLCQKLRRMANLHGADEAVLLADGYIADGALSAIVWWHNDVLHAPDETTPWLPSITREFVFELAEQAGFETKTVRAKPENLEGAEVWSLSSLQGIRGVTKWDELRLGELKRLGSFRKRLALLSEPIS